MNVGSVLAMQGLTKRFRRWRAPPLTVVDGLTFEIGDGEVVGLLGPNGAGKTTTLQMILGFLRPDEGSVQVLGGTMADPAIRRALGWVPDSPAFPKAMRVAEVLEYHGRLLGLDGKARDRARERLEWVGLADAAERKIAHLSRGMLQRLGLAQALLGEPKLLVLDEPVASLDPEGVLLVRNLLRAHAERGVTILVSSHLLSEVERISTRVLFLRAGRLVGTHRPQETSARLSVRVRLEAALSAELRAELHDAGSDGTALLLPVESESDIPALVARLVAAGARILAVEPGRQEEDLETLYLRHVEGPAS